MPLLPKLNYILLLIMQLASNMEWLFQGNANFFFPKLKFSRLLLPSKILLISTKTLYGLTLGVWYLLYL